MKEWMKGFLAIVAVIAGTILVAENAEVLAGRYSQDVWDVLRLTVGLVLLGGGATFFWTRSKFYKG